MPKRMTRNQQKAMFAKRLPLVKAKVISEVRSGDEFNGVHAIQKGYSGSRFFSKPQNLTVKGIKAQSSRITHKGITLVG